MFTCGPALLAPMATGGAGGDPYFSSVSLLLHMNGPNGSTTFTDSSSNVKPVSAQYDAQISTAQYKFGGASGYFDGSLDSLLLAVNDLQLDFGAGDFTIEAWVYRVSGSNSFALYCGQGDLASAAGSSLIFYCGGSSNTEFYNATSSYSVTSPSIVNGAWHHVAWTRSGADMQTFLDGAVVGTNSTIGTLAINVGATNFRPSIGAFANGGAPFNGYIDDFRITKGVARYTSAFTPPNAQFPDY